MAYTTSPLEACDYIDPSHTLPHAVPHMQFKHEEDSVTQTLDSSVAEGLLEVHAWGVRGVCVCDAWYM